MTKDQKDQLKGTIALSLLVGVPLMFFVGPIPLILIVIFGLLGMAK